MTAPWYKFGFSFPLDKYYSTIGLLANITSSEGFIKKHHRRIVYEDEAVIHRLRSRSFFKQPKWSASASLDLKPFSGVRTLRTSMRPCALLRRARLTTTAHSTLTIGTLVSCLRLRTHPHEGEYTRRQVGRPPGRYFGT